MNEPFPLFPQDYTSSRQRFRLQYERLRNRWPEARLEAYPLPGNEDLTIDWVHAPPSRKNERLILFTTGGAQTQIMWI